MMRPVPARWFEVLVAHDDAARALEALAATGAVELELHEGPRSTAPRTELRALLERYGELAARYRRYWPAPAGGVAASGSARAVFGQALAGIEHWRTEAEPAIRALQDLEQEREELAMWRELFTRFRGSELEFGLLRRADGLLARRLYVFPAGTVFAVPREVLARHFPLKDQACVLVLGPAEAVAALDRQAAALKGRRSGLGVPAWLAPRAADNLARVDERRRAVEAEAGGRRSELAALAERHALAARLAEIERLRWFAVEVHVLPGSEYFAWLTGWTSDLRGRTLAGALEAAGVHSLLRFPAPPPGAEAPLILSNPWWARPFELFARAIGVPARAEVDPSPILAVVVPLLFGYMFGDVGQGLVLVAAGLLLRRRFPFARLLIAGGGAAVVFGFLYGSLFTLERLIPALWLPPLSQPLTVLGMPLILGAALLALGLMLAGVEARWRGEFGRWARTEAGMLCAYLGVLAGILDARGFALAAAGLVWTVAGHAWQAGQLSGLLAGLAAAVEGMFQLGINTLSFARVGAFALAHAGLSSAVATLAQAADAVAVGAVVLVLGNVLIIALEGLVVSIQTTRLVLFEFFIRFLRAEGRAFRPLAAPQSHP